MDRALRREDLLDALGTHTPGVLPTVDELIDLIANVEIQAFMESFEVGEEILRAAWYLHGVASATQSHRAVLTSETTAGIRRQRPHLRSGAQRQLADSARPVDAHLRRTGRVPPG